MKKIYWRAIICSICATFALSIDMGAPTVTTSTPANIVGEVLWNIWISISNQGLGITPIALFLLFVLAHLYIEKKELDMKKISVKILNIFIAFVWVAAEGYRRDDIHVIYSTAGQVVKSVIYLIGVYCILTLMMDIFYVLLHSNEKMECSKNRVCRFYNKHTYWTSFVIIFTAWLPHLIVAYPAYFCHDSYNQLDQFFGFKPWSAHHPPVCTAIMGSIISLGRKISGNFGVFLFALFQMLVLVSICAYMMLLFRKLRTPKWLLVVTYVMLIFVPYYTAYIGLFLKDNLYSYMFMLLVIELVYLVQKKSSYFDSALHVILFCVADIGVMLLRNNGKYVVYPLTIVLGSLAIHFCRRRQLTYKTVILTLIMLLSPIVISNMISAGFNNYYNIEQGSIREALSLPMQQTARYVKYHSEDVTSSEKTVINNVMDYDQLAQLYNPIISDPVKKTFKYNPTTKELIAYIKVWFKQFLRHPKVYLDATLNQNYFLLYTGQRNNVTYVNDFSSNVGEDYQKHIVAYLGLQNIDGLSRAKSNIQNYYELCFTFPGLRLLSHPAFYNLILLWLIFFSFIKKDWRMLIVAIPAAINFVTIILAPVIQGHPRYAFPIIYTVPIIIAVFMHNSNEDSSNG